jgi:hypothetical protein
MEQSPSRGAGWLAFSSMVLIIGGIAGIIDGLMAVYRSSFFSSSAVFPFSTLNTWGWIAFGLGVAAVVSGLAIWSSAGEWARWLGVVVAGLAFLGQMVSAQAYPLWSLVLMGVYGLAVYGLVAHGDWWRETVAVETTREIGSTSEIGPTGTATPGEPSERRAA